MLTRRDPMLAGLVYFAIVFAVAFGFGTIRTLVLAPRIGATWAVVLEAPLVLTVSWLAARWCLAWFQVKGVAQRLAMGAIAFALLMAAELGLAVFAFGRPPETYFASFLSLAGGLGLAAQIGFALIPAVSPRPPTTRRRPGH